MAGIKISDIKEEFAASNIEGYTDLIAKYSDDERAGVINLIKRYQKEIDKHNKEVERTYNMQAFERKYGEYQYICGIDEVGRGPLAGPVCAGAVILPKDVDILYINDSKQLSAAKREEL